MSEIFGLIGMLIVGLLAGLLARFLVPGRDPMGCLATSLLGIGGSYVGGLLGSLLFNGEINLRQSNNFFGAVIGAIVALLLFRMIAGRRRY